MAEDQDAGGKDPGRAKRPVLLHVALLVLAVVAGFAVCVAGALVGRGGFTHVLAASMALGFTLPALLVAVACFAFAALRHRMREGRVLSWVGTLFLAAAILLASAAASVLPGALVNQRDIREAKLYCQSLVPQIETYRARNGSYPTDLGELGIALEETPHLLRCSPWFYWGDDEGYAFDFVDPSGMLNGFRWDSTDGVWVEWD